MTRRNRQALLAALGLLWVVVVLGAYYIFHKPVQPQEIVALGGALLDVLGIALLVSVASGLGRWVLHPHPLFPSPMQGEGKIKPSESPLSPRERGGQPEAAREVRGNVPERLALEALAGLALISVAVLIVGLAGVVNGAIYVGAALIVLAVLRNHALAWWRDLLRWLRGGFGSLGGAWSVFLAIFLALMLGMAFLNALAPATKWDALVYHLAGPKLYIEAGRIHGDIDNHFLGFPQLTEMLYLWLMAWRGVGAGAALIHWLFGALMLMLVGGYAARLTGEARVGLFAAAALLSGETLWWEFAWPYADLTVMAYVVVGFILLESALRDTGVGTQVASLSAGSLQNPSRALFAAGLMAGCALGGKYTAIGAAAGLGVLALWIVRRAGVRILLRAGAVFALGALAAFAPWLLKNALLYRNPVYPFFFEAADWDAYRQAWYTRAGTGLLSTAPLRLPLLPWDATVCSAEGVEGFASPFGAALPLCDPTGNGSLGATIGPLLLALIPLIAIGWRALSQRERDFVRNAVIYLVVPCAVWIYGLATSYLLEQTRLLFAVFPIFAMLAALGLEALRRTVVGQVRVGVVVTGAAGFVLILSLLTGALYSVSLGAAPVVAGAQPPRDFLLGKLGWDYAALEQVNALPDGANVMFLWEPRTFYCRAGVACQPDALLDRWYHDMRITGGDIDAVAARWQAEGITHVLLRDTGMRQLTAPGADPFESSDVGALGDLVVRYLTPVWAGEMNGERFVTLYRWQ